MMQRNVDSPTSVFREEEVEKVHDEAYQGAISIYRWNIVEDRAGFESLKLWVLFLICPSMIVKIASTDQKVLVCMREFRSFRIQQRVSCHERSVRRRFAFCGSSACIWVTVSSQARLGVTQETSCVNLESPLKHHVFGWTSS
ncbi:hypothetical protein Bca101_032006 [Brassica carinata]